MNSTIKTTGLISLGILLATSVATAQYTFDVPGPDGAVNVTGISATGTVNFLGLGDNDESSTASVYIENNTLAPITSAYITGFFIRKPWADVGDDTDATNDNVAWTLSTGLPNWTATDEDTNYGDLSGLPGIGGNLDEYFFFGSVVDSNPTANGIGMGSSATFTFNFTGTGADNLDLSVYNTPHGDDDLPSIIVRWQSISGGTGTSAKGWTYFELPPPIIPPVPEPAEIALLSLLGMGGLIFVRRRISRKTASK